MILIHRITPFFIACSVVVGFILLTLFPSHPFLTILPALLFVGLLLGRLVGWKFRAFSFWAFVGTPMLFVASSFFFVLFLGDGLHRGAVMLVAALFTFFYAEHLFSYIRTPSTYMPYALEHLTMLLSVMTVFLGVSAAFGLRMFLQAPISLLSAGVFALISFLAYATFWTSKVEHKRGLAFGMGGALILTELFAALSFLPTTFFVNATAIALGAYLFLGVSRAHFVQTLSRKTISWYAAVCAVLFVFIAGTAQWN